VNDPAFQARIMLRAGVAVQLIRQTGTPRLLVHLGCGEGLLTHLLASAGLNILALDPSAGKLALAQQCLGRRDYPAGVPRCVRLERLAHLPVEDQAADLVVIFDFLERHPNPIALFREVWRVLRPDGYMLIVTPFPPPHVDPSAPRIPGASGARGTPLWNEHYYEYNALTNQVSLSGGWETIKVENPGVVLHEHILAARKKARPGNVPTPSV